MKGRQLHHLLAPVAAIGLLWLLISGLLLNHSHHLRLDHRPLPDSLLPWLNASAPATTRHWQLSQHMLSEIDGQLFWDGRKLDGQSAQSLYPFPLGWVVITRHQLLLVDPDGLEIARLPLPASSARLTGTSPLKLQSLHQCWTLDETMTRWTHCRSSSQPPLSSVTAQAGAAPQALAAWKIDHQLTWETLLHRMHTLRLFGQAGTWLLDGMALIIAVLLISGLRLRFRQARRPRAKGS